MFEQLNVKCVETRSFQEGVLSTIYSALFKALQNLGRYCKLPCRVAATKHGAWPRTKDRNVAYVDQDSRRPTAFDPFLTGRRDPLGFSLRLLALQALEDLIVSGLISFHGNLFYGDMCTETMTSRVRCVPRPKKASRRRKTSQIDENNPRGTSRHGNNEFFRDL